MVRNVLFVDDDAILCRAVEKSLAKYSENFAVVTACDGFDAVKQLKKTPVSLIVLELILPRMDGMSLVNHLRENYPDLPAIIISSMDEAHLQEIAKVKGIIGYIKKPFQTEKLVTTINGVLQKEAAGGIMHDISPTVFLQLMEMDAKSCTIRVLDNASHQGGILYFKEGELLDVRIGNLHGIEAAYELFSWDTATVFLRNECEPRKNNINSELTPIIMKAVGMKDEAEETPMEDSSSPALQGNGKKEQTIAADSTTVEFLKNKLGKELGLKGCLQDTQVTNAVELLTEISRNSGFGEFKFAYITNDKSYRIVLAGQPPTVLDIAPTCTPEKIINLLNSGESKA